MKLIPLTQGERKYLGGFNIEKEAAQAYQEALEEVELEESSLPGMSIEEIKTICTQIRRDNVSAMF